MSDITPEQWMADHIEQLNALSEVIRHAFTPTLSVADLLTDWNLPAFSDDEPDANNWDAAGEYYE